ncbi:5373_t:CDS:1 [Ambispora leptoticha]|uniref:5373_t:CDS:1 n=1 Tax=Ambispora leptoticha TaxID=144679 RepID=A0A9N9IIJ8_9GLOM|nr:5373_t:CDS:1 [Ambispora leptoticha]
MPGDLDGDQIYEFGFFEGYPIVLLTDKKSAKIGQEQAQITKLINKDSPENNPLILSKTKKRLDPYLPITIIIFVIPPIILFFLITIIYIYWKFFFVPRNMKKVNVRYIKASLHCPDEAKCENSCGTKIDKYYDNNGDNDDSRPFISSITTRIKSLKMKPTLNLDRKTTDFERGFDYEDCDDECCAFNSGIP